MIKTSIAIAVVTAPLLVSPSPASGVESEAVYPAIQSPRVGDLEQLTEAELGLLLSGHPKKIFVDAYSGDIVGVEKRAAVSAPSATPFAAYSNGCSGSRGCWQGYGPTPWYGFSTGVTKGSWPNRLNFTTAANRYAKLCWIPQNSTLPTRPAGEFCMPERHGNNATISLGAPVTGTKVDYQTYR